MAAARSSWNEAPVFVFQGSPGADEEPAVAQEASADLPARLSRQGGSRHPLRVRRPGAGGDAPGAAPATAAGPAAAVPHQATQPATSTTEQQQQQQHPPAPFMFATPGKDAGGSAFGHICLVAFSRHRFPTPLAALQALDRPALPPRRGDLGRALQAPAAAPLFRSAAPPAWLGAPTLAPPPPRPPPCLAPPPARKPQAQPRPPLRRRPLHQHRPPPPGRP
jgi:hypothetical protein